MGNENNQFTESNWTESDWVCAIVYITYLFWPFVLVLLFGALFPLFFLITGDIEYLILFLPVGFTYLFIWGYRKALRDTAEIARQRQQPPPKLSKWEEKKKAESLYKFP